MGHFDEDGLVERDTLGGELDQARGHLVRLHERQDRLEVPGLDELARDPCGLLNGAGRDDDADPGAAATLHDAAALVDQEADQELGAGRRRKARQVRGFERLFRDDSLDRLVQVLLPLVDVAVADAVTDAAATGLVVGIVVTASSSSSRPKVVAAVQPVIFHWDN